MIQPALSEKEVMSGGAGSVRQKCRWLGDDEAGWWVGGDETLVSQGLRDEPWRAKLGGETVGAQRRC